MELCDQCGSFGEIQSLCSGCGKLICYACSGNSRQCAMCIEKGVTGTDNKVQGVPSNLATG